MKTRLVSLVGRPSLSFLLVAAASLLVSACGGGGGDSAAAAPATPSSALTTEQKRVLLADSQGRARWVMPMYPAGTVDRSKSWRWNHQRDGLIPVKISGDPAVITAALDQVEAAVGQRLFDRDLYRTTSELQVTRGIILKAGTPPPAAGVVNNCGVAQPAMPIAAPNFLFNGVSVTPAALETVIWLDVTQSFNPSPIEVAFPNEESFKRQDGLKKRAVVEILVDTSNPNCSNPQALYVHELSHALGLMGHFDGFGLGTENSEKYLGLLKMLYSNPAGTAFSQLN